LHCSYRFLSFAQAHNIIILCLPLHTTHILQPCDVSVFGPLAIHWKTEVLLAGRQLVPITKNNLLRFYSNTQTKAFKTTSVPLLNLAIVVIYEAPAASPTISIPTELTASSTQIPITCPNKLTPDPTLDVHGVVNQDPPVESSAVEIWLLIPLLLPVTASRADLQMQNTELYRLLKVAEYQIQRDDLQKRLMDMENGQLRQQLFNWEQKKTDIHVTSEAYHLTEEQVLIKKGLANWKAKMKLINQSLKPRFKIEQEKIDAVLKEQVSKEKQAGEARKRALQVLKLQCLEAEKEAGRWHREMTALAKEMQDVADADTKKEAKQHAKLKKAVLQKLPARQKKAMPVVSSPTMIVLVPAHRLTYQALLNNVPSHGLSSEQ